MQLSRIGPFALEEPLEGSAESNVLRGVHVERPLTMAIKLLPRSVTKQAMGASNFAADIKRLQALEHSGIARIHGGAIENGQPYLVLEMVTGESLRDLLERRGKLPWELAVDIAADVCQALDYAHQAGFVHLRLTPNRVLLTSEGNVKLVGFDCAWADRDEVLGLHVSMDVAHYLAPEQFRGKKSSTAPQCDLFGLGVILFECLSGELPWPADSAGDLIEARRARIASRVSTRVLDCPVWLDALVSRLLAANRSDRLASAEETHRAIVTAKRKADKGTGAAQHAWSGKQGVLDVGQDRDELSRIKRQRTKPKSRDPFYEQAWFLALCLLGLIGIGTWAMWPPSEEALYAKAKPLMESSSPVDWKRAQEQYLKPLHERFPNTRYAAEIQDFEDRYKMHLADERIKNLDRFGRKPRSKVESQYAVAWKLEQFGDRYSALKKYEALINLFAEIEDPKDRAVVNLARRQKKLLSDRDLQDDLAQFLQSQIETARSLAAEGKRLKARGVLDSLVILYANNQEVHPLVEEARELIRQLDGGE